MTNYNNEKLNYYIFDYVSKIDRKKGSNCKIVLEALKELLDIQDACPLSLKSKYATETNIESLKPYLSATVKQYKPPFSRKNPKHNYLTQYLNSTYKNNLTLPYYPSSKTSITQTLVSEFQMLNVSLCHYNLDGYTSDMIEAIILHPTGEYALTGGDDGQLKVYSTINFQAICSIKVEEFINDIVINQEGNIILVQCENNYNLFVLLFRNENLYNVKQIVSSTKIFISEFYNNDIIYGTKDYIFRNNFNPIYNKKVNECILSRINTLFYENSDIIKKVPNKITMVFVNESLGVLFIGCKFGIILMYDLKKQQIFSELNDQTSSIEILSHERFLISKDKTNNLYIYDIPFYRKNNEFDNDDKLYTLSVPNDYQTVHQKLYSNEDIYTIDINKSNTQICLSLINRTNTVYSLELYSLLSFQTLTRLTKNEENMFDSKINVCKFNPKSEYVLAVVTHHGYLMIYDTSMVEELMKIRMITRFLLPATHVNLINAEDRMTICNLEWATQGDRIYVSCDVGTVFVIGSGSSQVFNTSYMFQKFSCELASYQEIDNMFNTNNSNRDILLNKRYGVDSSKCMIDMNMYPYEHQPHNTCKKSFYENLCKRIIFNEKHAKELQDENKNIGNNKLTFNKFSMFQLELQNKLKSNEDYIISQQPTILSKSSQKKKKNKLSKSEKPTRANKLNSDYNLRRNPRKKKDIYLDYAENQMDLKSDGDYSEDMNDVEPQIHNNNKHEIESMSSVKTQVVDDINDRVVNSLSQKSQDNVINNFNKFNRNIDSGSDNANNNDKFEIESQESTKKRSSKHKRKTIPFVLDESVESEAKEDSENKYKYQKGNNTESSSESSASIESTSQSEDSQVDDVQIDSNEIKETVYDIDMDKDEGFNIYSKNDETNSKRKRIDYLENLSNSNSPVNSQTKKIKTLNIAYSSSEEVENIDDDDDNTLTFNLTEYQKLTNVVNKHHNNNFNYDTLIANSCNNTMYYFYHISHKIDMKNDINLLLIEEDFEKFWDDRTKLFTGNFSILGSYSKNQSTKIIQKRNSFKCLVCKDNNIPLHPMFDYDTYQKVKNENISTFYFCDTRSNNMFICAFCLNEIRKSKMLFTTKNNKWHYCAMLNRLFEKAKSNNCIRCKYSGAVIVCSECNNNYHPFCSYKCNPDPNYLIEKNFKCYNCIDTAIVKQSIKTNKWLFQSDKDNRGNLLKFIYQTNDKVYYLFQAHEQYLNKYYIKESRPYIDHHELTQSDALCEILNISYSNDDTIKLNYEYIHMLITLKHENIEFTLSYHPNDCPDFLVPEIQYLQNKNLKKQERINLYTNDSQWPVTVIDPHSYIEDKFRSKFNNVLVMQQSESETENNKNSRRCNSFEFLRVSVWELLPKKIPQSQVGSILVKIKKLFTKYREENPFIDYHNENFWNELCPNILFTPNFEYIRFKAMNKVYREKKAIWDDIETLKKNYFKIKRDVIEEYPKIVEFISQLEKILKESM